MFLKNKNLNLWNNTSLSERILFINVLLISILPLSLLVGSLVFNIIIILINLIFLLNLIQYKDFNFFKNKFFYLLCFFWLGLILNLFFSSDQFNSLSRSLGFLRFIILVMAIIYILRFNSFKYFKLIFNTWTGIFFFVSIDLIFEYFIGHNLFGLKSDYPGRLAGILGSELKIGNFYFGFGGMILIYLFNRFKDLRLFFFIGIFLIIISMLIGERANFIRFIIVIFTTFGIVSVFKKKIKIFLSFFLTVLTILISLYSLDKYYNQEKLVDAKGTYYKRYIKELHRIHNKSIIGYLKDSTHGGHYETSIKIFNNYKITGVGLKNFRNFSGKKEYQPESNPNSRLTTHPHQIYFEILSEMGILGFTFFILFFYFSIRLVIKKFLINKNLLSIPPLVLILSHFLPLIPMGSFFTSYSASIFWINYAVMVSFCEKKNMF